MKRTKLAVLILVLLVGYHYGLSVKLAVLPDIATPDNIECIENELYVLDGVTVFVYSLTDYRLLRTFGKKGEGPGELLPHPELAVQMQFVDETIRLGTLNKFITYSKNGKKISEKKISFIQTQLLRCGENYAAVKYSVANGKVIYNVVLLGETFNELKSLYSMARDHPMKIKRINMPLRVLNIYFSAGKIYIVDQKKDAGITVFDQKGNRLKPLIFDYPVIEISETFKNNFMEWFKTDKRYRRFPEDVRKMICFPETLPAIRTIQIKNERIYVRTYRKKKQFGEFYVHDLEGRRLTRLFLPVGTEKPIQIGPETTYTFADERYYYLVENLDNEEWELHMETLPAIQVKK
jgi:hypothetical protein